MSGSTKLMTAGGGGVALTPASSIASDVTVSVPSVNGTAVVTSSAVSAAGQIPFSTDGSTFTPTAKIVSGTAVASTSGTSIDFTGIPSWVKRITVMFNSVSTSGTSAIIVQIGDSGGIEITGYADTVGNIATSTASTTSTGGSGFAISNVGSISDAASGSVCLSLIGSNTWVLSGVIRLNASRISYSAGSKALSDTLTQIRVTTFNGTDTFDLGSINILYE